MCFLYVLFLDSTSFRFIISRNLFWLTQSVALFQETSFWLTQSVALFQETSIILRTYNYKKIPNCIDKINISAFYLIMLELWYILFVVNFLGFPKTLVGILAQKTDSSSSKINCFKGISLLPYILHTTVLALFGVFCIRVQVCITHTLY